MGERICQNCGEASPLSAKFCRYCGDEIETVASPARRDETRQVNRTDAAMVDVLKSKTLKIYLSFLFTVFCLFPALCLFMGMLGLIPLNMMLRDLLSL